MKKLLIEKAVFAVSVMITLTAITASTNSLNKADLIYCQSSSFDSQYTFDTKAQDLYIGKSATHSCVKQRN